MSTLVARALGAKREHVEWKYIRALHWRGTGEVLEEAAALCTSKVARRRRLGADILGQIGVPERTFPGEALRILHRVLRTEKNASVLNSVLIALGHTQPADDLRGLRWIVRYRRHPSADVRFGLVFALLGRPDPVSLATLVRLAEDSDDDVRDWATFGLGSQVDVDSPEIREALWRRVEDRCVDARGEAIVGLVSQEGPTAPRALQGYPLGRRRSVRGAAGNGRRKCHLPDAVDSNIEPDGSRFLMTRIARPEFARRRIDVVLGFDTLLQDLP